MAEGPWPVGQRCHWNGEQPFCGASLGQAFDTLLSSLWCPFTDEEIEALKANQQGHAAAQRRRQGLLACSSPLVSAGSLGLSRGCAPKPQFFLLFHFASLLCLLPLGLLPAPLTSAGCAPLTPMEGQTTAPENRQSGSPLLSLFSPLPPSCISSPAGHPEPGEEETPEEAGARLARLETQLIKGLFMKPEGLQVHSQRAAGP